MHDAPVITRKPSRPFLRVSPGRAKWASQRTSRNVFRLVALSLVLAVVVYKSSLLLRVSLKPSPPTELEAPLDSDSSTELDSEYHAHLLSFHGPSPSSIPFDHVYVISLANRPSRRKEMRQLLRALALHPVTIVDAVSVNSTVIRWVAEHAAATRKKKQALLTAWTAPADGYQDESEEPQWGGQDTDSPLLWPSTSIAPYPRARLHPDPFLPQLQGMLFPSLATDEYEGYDWARWLLHVGPERWDELKPKDGALNVSEVMWDPVDRYPNRQPNAGTIACALSHLKTLLLARSVGDSAALILEDDVDLEFSFPSLWASISRVLPLGGKELGWQSVFVGHCWGREAQGSHYYHPRLFRSVAPRCTHAYVVSAAGIAHLIKVLTDPWTAFQVAIDTTYASLILRGGLISFSLEPPAAIQRKNSASDIRTSTGTKWRGLLEDSTADRVARDEGREPTEERQTREEMEEDPWGHNWRMEGPMPKLAYVSGHDGWGHRERRG